MTKLEEIIEEFENIQDWAMPDVLNRANDFIRKAYQAGIEAALVEAKEDYIRWVFGNTYGQEKYPYTGKTPFAKWKDEADVRDMQNWK